MSQRDDLERLSMWLAGELPDAEARVLASEVARRPELAALVERLRALDSFQPAHEEAPRVDLIQRAIGATSRKPPLRRIAFAAIAAAAALIAISLASSPRAPDGDGVSETSVTSIAAAEFVETSEGVRLDRGTIVVKGKVRIETALGVAIDVDGQSIISTEPERALAHVTAALNPPEGERMHTLMKKWRVGSVAGAMLAVWLVDGTALARIPTRDAVPLKEGDAWLHPQALFKRETAQTPTKPVQSVALATAPDASVPVAEKPGWMMLLAFETEEISPKELTQALREIAFVPAQQCMGNQVEGFKLTTWLHITAHEGKGALESVEFDPPEGAINPPDLECLRTLMNTAAYPAPKVDRPVRVGLTLRLRSVMAMPPPDGGTAAPDGGVLSLEVGASPTRGASTAPVTLYEFSDFECPFCSAGHETVMELQRSYGDRLRVVFKNRPMPFHSQARGAALAAMAAGEQGRFWEYAAVLYQNQDALSPGALEAYASTLGLDLVTFRAAMTSDRLAARLASDIALADSVQASGIPTFFVNGKKVVGAVEATKLRALVDEALKVP